MTLFAIWQSYPRGADGTLAEAIQTSGLQFYPLGDANWLVSTTGTARELAERIGMHDGRRGTGLITEVAGYYGRYDPGLWSWMRVQLEGGRSVG